VLSVATADRSVALVPVDVSMGAVAASEAELTSSSLNIFLARCREVGFTNLLLVGSSESAVQLALSEQNKAHGFKMLLQDGANTAATSSISSFLLMRVRQLLAHGVHVGLFNVHAAMVWNSPFDLMTNSATDRTNEAAMTSTEQSQAAFFARAGRYRSPMTATSSSSNAFLRPLSETRCDLFGPGAAGITPAASAHNGALLLSHGGSSTAWTFLSVQPTAAAVRWAGKAIGCTMAPPEQMVQSKASPSFSVTGVACMEHAANELRLAGALSVCELDTHYFPPSSAFFEPPAIAAVTSPSPGVSDAAPLPGRGSSTWRHASESGVWPLVGPRRHESSTTGRVQEWDKEWRTRSQTMLDSVLGWTGPAPDPRPPNMEGQPMGAPGQKSVACASDPAASFTFRLRVLAFNRLASLKRLLSSLAAADYLGDSGRIRLEISVDRPRGEDLPNVSNSESENERRRRTEAELDAAARSASSLDESNPSLTASARRLQVLSFLRTFTWSHGDLSLSLLSSHHGLVGQWLLTPGAEVTGDRDIVLTLEDDLELSPAFYAFVKGAVCAYYIEPAMAKKKKVPADTDPTGAPSFDPALFGLSLQKQHYVLGQSAKNVQWQFMRFREEKAKAEARVSADPAVARAADPAAAKKEALAAAVSRIDPASLFEFDRAIGDPARVPLYRYQLLGTWGLLVFPSHWRPFLHWARVHLTKNEVAMRAARAEGITAADALSLQLPALPCVPHLEVSAWWSARPHAVWSAWFVRYVFQHGWYGLYAHLTDGQALATSHREAGENHAKKIGTRDELFQSKAKGNNPAARGAEQAIVAEAGLPSASASSGGQFRFPSLARTPLFDFHLQRASNSAVLRQRAAMLTQGQLKQGCTAKDYAQYEP
jgi:hypothetical protein